MIRPIDIRLNAAHPELPLCEAVTYTGAPATVLIRGVPPNCGRWAITAVFVAASFPDGSTTTRAAVQSANGVWVATLPATATSGRTANGIRVIADGVNETGEAVTGYILGVADFAVASLAVTPAPEPGETSYQMLYFDEVPSVLRKGDVTKIDGVLKFYNGMAWETFAAAADVPTPSSTAPVMDGTATPGVSNDYARGDHVHPSDTSRMAATATGADIPVSDMDSTKIDAALAGKADCVSNPTDGHLAALDENGNLTDSGKAPNDFALIGDIAPDWMDTTEIGTVFVADQLCSFSGRTYRCILGYTFSGEDTPPADTTHWALATVEDVLAALRTGKLSTSGGTVTGDISMENGLLDAGDVQTRSMFDFLQPGQSVKSLDAPENSGKALTDADIEDSSSALGAALGGKLNKSGGTMQGDLNINGRDINITSAGRVIVRGLNGYVAVFANDGIDFSTDDAMSWTHFDWPSASGTLALTSAIPYKLVTKTITNGAVSLDDRAINAVAVSSSLASLTVNFPAATSGKARDFGVRLTVASGITTAPQLVLPQGVSCENADGTAPEIGADGAATILYFTETASGVFLVKGETVQTIS